MKEKVSKTVDETKEEVTETMAISKEENAELWRKLWKLKRKGGLKCAAKDNICAISALQGVRVVPRVLPRSLQVCRHWGTFYYSEKKIDKSNEHTSSLLIGPMPVQSPLMGSKQHVSSFCKPNQCCPFLHSLVPLRKK